MSSKFKVGDKVRARESCKGLDMVAQSNVYTVAEVYAKYEGMVHDYVRLEGHVLPWSTSMFDLVAPAAGPAITPAQARKNKPVMTGCFDYFPDALMAVAEISRIGNEQHHPGAPLHWEKDKSADHADCCVRHLLDRGTKDTDGADHSGKAAWRALANYQTELEAADPELAALRQSQRDAAAKGRR